MISIQMNKEQYISELEVECMKCLECLSWLTEVEKKLVMSEFEVIKGEMYEEILDCYEYESLYVGLIERALTASFDEIISEWDTGVSSVDVLKREHDKAYNDVMGEFSRKMQVFLYRYGGRLSAKVRGGSRTVETIPQMVFLRRFDWALDCGFMSIQESLGDLRCYC